MNVKQLDALQSVTNACSPCKLRDNNEPNYIGELKKGILLLLLLHLTFVNGIQSEMKNSNCFVVVVVVILAVVVFFHRSVLLTFSFNCKSAWLSLLITRLGRRYLLHYNQSESPASLKGSFNIILRRALTVWQTARRNAMKESCKELELSKFQKTETDFKKNDFICASGTSKTDMEQKQSRGGGGGGGVWGTLKNAGSFLW